MCWRRCNRRRFFCESPNAEESRFFNIMRSRFFVFFIYTLPNVTETVVGFSLYQATVSLWLLLLLLLVTKKSGRSSPTEAEPQQTNVASGEIFRTKKTQLLCAYPREQDHSPPRRDSEGGGGAYLRSCQDASTSGDTYGIENCSVLLVLSKQQY